jgi:hypothetical protein
VGRTLLSAAFEVALGSCSAGNTRIYAKKRGQEAPPHTGLEGSATVKKSILPH